MALRLAVRANVTNRIPQDAGVRLDAAMRDAISDATRIGRDLTRAAINSRTGRTAASVGASVSGGGNSVTGTFGSDSAIFEDLEHGTVPHIITPRTAEALFWPGAEHPVRLVRHPGTAAQHNLERSAEAAGEVAKEKLAGVFGEVFG